MRPVARRSRTEQRHASTSRTSSTTTSAAPRSAISRRWSPTRPTSCSRAPKRRPTPPSAPSALDKWRKGESPATTYPDASKGADQRCRQMIRNALQTVAPDAAPAEAAAARRAHRAGAARLDPGVLRNGRNRRRDPVGRRRPPARQGASQDPDGRHHRRDRSLSRLADAERHHAGDPKAAATASSPVSMRWPSSATPAPAWS